jgi:predicted nucleic acid-binding protein
MMTYVDASALVKLVIEEAESSSLQAFLEEATGLSTSELAEVEVPRAAARAGGGARAIRRAQDLLACCHVVNLNPLVKHAAVKLAPQSLKSLGAIHLASALLLREHVGAFVTYDSRLASAASAAGLPVASPGQ